MASLPGALLLPRGQMPLNIFEPRYLAMVDDALRLLPATPAATRVTHVMKSRLRMAGLLSTRAVRSPEP